MTSEGLRLDYAFEIEDDYKGGLLLLLQAVEQGEEEGGSKEVGWREGITEGLFYCYGLVGFLKEEVGLSLLDQDGSFLIELLD